MAKIMLNAFLKFSFKYTLKTGIFSILINDGIPRATFGNNKSGINVTKIKVN